MTATPSLTSDASNASRESLEDKLDRLFGDMLVGVRRTLKDEIMSAVQSREAAIRQEAEREAVWAVLNRIEESIHQHTVPEGKGLITRSYVKNTIEFERQRIRGELSAPTNSRKEGEDGRKQS